MFSTNLTLEGSIFQIVGFSTLVSKECNNNGVMAPCVHRACSSLQYSYTRLLTEKCMESNDTNRKVDMTSDRKPMQIQ